MIFNLIGFLLWPYGVVDFSNCELEGGKRHVLLFDSGVLALVILQEQATPLLRWFCDGLSRNFKRGTWLGR